MYPFIEHANEASFIKSKNSNTKAVPITFNLQEQPYTLYIPKQSSDTAVCKYQDRAMVCHNCHKYGHTKTGWRRKAVCRNCGEEDRTSDKKNKCPNKSMCSNCEEGHMAGSINCEVEIEEMVIKKFKAISRVGRRRAFQVLAIEDESPRSKPQSNPTHFRCKMDPENERNFNLWQKKRASPMNLEANPLP